MRRRPTRRSGRPRAGGARRRGALTLGRIAGAPVLLRPSWFLVAAALVLLFGPQVARIFPELGALAYAVALGYAAALLLSVLIHEAAHALTATAFGWPPVAVELNIWGGHTEFVARGATPGRSVAVAMAGPAANLAVAGLCAAVLQLQTVTGVAALLLWVVVVLNLLVGGFNALPGLPLDGGRLVESAVWAATGDQDRGTLAAGWAGRLLVVGLLAAVAIWVLLDPGRSLLLVVLAVMMAFVLWQGAGEAVRGARRRLTHREDADRQR
ncbi:MAG: hypothetical protein Q4F53_00660 [Nesterenkonia sp.]|uniref:site-2 protease family protein n=1 Tax=Nesterenkonia marinintestina TaxID=2979865 RepID=UPI0021BF55BD|nr:site-2 protease family protein [Nesterenkonia sp. GX14115]MDO5492107.1 hypothetical protein [Nesterenkonia sp.]